jgi:hypothetical protein
VSLIEGPVRKHFPVLVLVLVLVAVLVAVLVRETVSTSC